MTLGIAHGIWSVAILGVFIALVAWVWSGRRRDHFENAGLIPFREDHDGSEP